MKKILKKGFIVLSIYLVAVATTFAISGRIEELNSNSSNTNKALSINLSK